MLYVWICFSSVIFSRSLVAGAGKKHQPRAALRASSDPRGHARKPRGQEKRLLRALAIRQYGAGSVRAASVGPVVKAAQRANVKSRRLALLF